MTRTQTDDETEFQRIPIAGENESDYEDNDEYEEEEDLRMPYLDQEDLDEANSTDTEDDAIIIQQTPTKKKTRSQFQIMKKSQKTSNTRT